MLYGILSHLPAVLVPLSNACPDGYHTVYCNTCPETKCLVTASDEGQYSCTLSNLQGSVSSGTGTLSVLGTPGVAADVDYPMPDQFGNLMLSNVQVSMSGEYEVQVRLPEFGTNREPLNTNSPRSVNVDVEVATEVQYPTPD